MANKRSLVSLFLLFSVSVIFLFSLFRSSLPLSSHTFHSSSPSFQSLKTHDPNTISIPRFTLNIKVLTFDRFASLSRCLRSLAATDYAGDRVNLHIFIDHFKILDDASVDFDLKLNESRRILDFVDGFSWEFGEKMVHYRTTNSGLQAQWLEAWWPSSDHEFAFVVEDDLEVSPLYYRFLRGLIVKYYYNATNFSPSIYGASIQRPRFVPGKHGRKMQLDSATRLFLYQLVGTWGQLLFPGPWKEFRVWYDTNKVKGMKPFLEGMVTTGWYKKMGERIWTPWFIKFVHARGYFNMYTNFFHEAALSISHRDAGVNYRKTVGPDSFLLERNSLDINSLEMHPLSRLKWYDFCFREVIPGRVVRSSDELGFVLHSVQKLETVVLVSLYGVVEAVIRNLLCHFERLNIRNYILVGPKSDVLLDLARRGHPVIDADQYFESNRVYRSMGFQESRTLLIKELLVTAYAIKKSLELRYSIWVLDGNMLPVSKDSFLTSIDPTYDFYVGRIIKVLFVRSSSSAWKIWGDDFIYKVSGVVGLGMKEELPTSDAESFVHVLSRLLEQRGVKIKEIDDICFDITVDTTGVNQTLRGGKKIVFWSSGLDLNLACKRLEELGFWIVEADFSCKAVICHPP